MKEVFNEVDRLNETLFKDSVFKAWETGLNSTERRNLSRVRRVLDLLDELNRNNLKDGDKVFYFCSVLIKEFMSRTYDIKGTDNTYSIKRKVK